MDATHRCDRCGAQACVSAIYPASELLFCAHHMREHGTVILATAWTVVDERPVLTP